MHKKEPSTAELATETGFTREQVEKLVAAERTPRALEAPLGDDEGIDGAFGELLADPFAEDEYEQVDRRLEIEALRRLPCELCERERTILRGRFGLDGGEQTLRELGASLDLSAERVRQIEERALDKLRTAACHWDAGLKALLQPHPAHPPRPGSSRLDPRGARARASRPSRPRQRQRPPV